MGNDNLASKGMEDGSQWALLESMASSIPFTEDNLGRIVLAIDGTVPRCLMCGRTDETERSGRLHVNPDGAAAHVECAKLYVAVRALEEIA